MKHKEGEGVVGPAVQIAVQVKAVKINVCKLKTLIICTNIEYLYDRKCFDHEAKDFKISINPGPRYKLP